MTTVETTSVSPNSTNAMLVAGLNESANIIFQNNKEKGFWDKERNVGELLMLITSELGEAMEAHRKGKVGRMKSFESDMGYARLSLEDFTPENQNYLWIANRFETTVKDTFEDEIADAVIRLLDLSAGLGIDLEKHINAKVQYNKSRERLHGKSY
jgi:NTP pyrophosphatase (non-canonical NTP hydrolase)